MGWSYMLTCICDFILFPIGWSLLQAVKSGTITLQWQPITLQGAGLYHVAMGAVLGIAAFGRTQEKIAGVNDNFQISRNVTSQYSPVYQQETAAYSPDIYSYKYPSEVPPAKVVVGYGGRPAPMQYEDPLV